MSGSSSSTGSSSVSPTPPEKEGFFTKFIKTIKDQINDLSYVEIVTAVGDPKTDVNPDAEKVFLGYKEGGLKILARTRIELDGDILMILPAEGINSNDVQINKEIMAIHKENVDADCEKLEQFHAEHINRP